MPPPLLLLRHCLPPRAGHHSPVANRCSSASPRTLDRAGEPLFRHSTSIHATAAAPPPPLSAPSRRSPLAIAAAPPPLLSAPLAINPTELLLSSPPNRRYKRVRAWRLVILLNLSIPVVLKVSSVVFRTLDPRSKFEGRAILGSPELSYKLFRS